MIFKGVGVGGLVYQHKRVYRCPLGVSPASSFTMVEGTAHWVYCGIVEEYGIAKFVRFNVRTGGTSTQTAEVAIAYSATAPNGASVTLFRIAANGTLSALTGTGGMSNTVAMAARLYPGMYLWAGMRTAMAGNEPVIVGLGADLAEGFVASTASAGALTGGTGVWVGAIAAAITGASAPDLNITLD